MAVMLPSWTFFTAVIVLAPQLCAGENSCSIMSTAGSVVELGSSFKVYCTFKCPCKCKRSMCSDHPPSLQGHEVFNSTTVYFNVANITMNKTYSCQCDCPQAPDSCGMDIFTGYAPALPSNISCVYEVQTNDSRTVLCTWDRGRDTFLTTNSSLWVRTPSGQHTPGPVMYAVSRNGADFLSASLAVSGSVQQVSVWVESKNSLGSAESVPINYTLSDIAMPSAPDLSPPTCSSQECLINVTQSVRVETLEIQYRSEADAWTSLPDSGGQATLSLARSISSLRPYRLYHFRARARFKTGVWSQWSADVSSWTKEEAPATEPDVWHVEADVKSLRVYWKEEDLSAARGKITQYTVSVHSPNSGLVFSATLGANAKNCTVPFGVGCGVKVRSCTSKGCSPPAEISPRHKKAKPLQIAHEITDQSSVAISWRKAETAERQAGFVVEWYPEGHKLEELQWIRLGLNDSRALLTGLDPFECYAGAVYAVYRDNAVSGTGFTGVATSQSVPAAVPLVLEKVEGSNVNVSWMQIPRGQRGGCITGYAIYLESSSGDRQVFPVAASEKTYGLVDLPPATYTLWMTASTSVGEGPIGPRSKVKFFIQQAPLVTLPLAAVLISMMVLLLMCLYQSAAVKQRVRTYLQSLLPGKVPDPANSKWAKECVLQTGKMKLQLQWSMSSVTAEDDPILVEVEELPQQSRHPEVPGASSQPPSPSRLSPVSKPTVLLYPLTTYIKSFSHDSSSSNQTSLETNATVDYISAHEPEPEDEEEEEEEEEEEFPEMTGFFPSHNFFGDSLEFGGKLTLDAVKINCGEFFLNNF
ncbi:interleukin-12 receptor subunit beta-2 [Takifugu flavidus]|uniref:interleukin-12 receptor subunit beta-2 n=1 Tax=Takifugu flavidus TaxID=433684 RepID=UPI002544025C|nr:interleukin-12 receptor subunit beta-2 [Takifugu flavidus]